MKRYEVVKEGLNYGKACEWYNHKNVEAVKAAKVLRKLGNKCFYCGYFVEAVEVVRDDMREFRPVYEVRKAVAGPFASVEAAEAWAAANN